MRIHDLDTPALLVDLDIMERNLKRAAEYAREHNLRLRPHTKTHKTPALGRLQLDFGAAGLTVAKVSEAEVMVEAEPADLLIAYPIVSGRKVARLMRVARHTRVTVAVDSVEAASGISEAAAVEGVVIHILAEMDVGMGRAGVAPGPSLVELARAITGMPALELDGVAFYPGHIKSLDEAGFRALDALASVVARVSEDFRREGLPLHIVSGGSTPALYYSHRVTGLNEIRPGTYIFNDRNCVACGACRWEDCAATILATVVSTARPNGMLIDGGSKTFFSDRLVTGGDNYFGHILEAPEARFFKMNEEHGYIDLADSPRHFRIGDRLRVIPNHICVAVALHEKIYGIRGEDVVEVWKVAGRGKLQ